MNDANRLGTKIGLYLGNLLASVLITFPTWLAWRAVAVEFGAPDFGLLETFGGLWLLGVASIYARGIGTNASYALGLRHGRTEK